MDTHTRRLDRSLREVDRITAAMQRGATLHMHYQRGRALWRLSSGQFVMPEAAGIVIKNINVVPDPDTLFPDALAQTWRYA